MKYLLITLFFFVPILTIAQTTVEKYSVDSASAEHTGVPKGEILKFSFNNSKIFPGTWREYYVYVPAQYDPSKPACVFVDQDGIQFKSPVVFDNLINSKEIPITIGVYISPGRIRARDTAALDRYNRSLEFDGLGDAYARFVLDELLPDVEKHTTTNGRAIKLSHKGNDRMIAGSSSGAICAFTAAWERPDAFSRVFSGVGTYVSMRGGDRYPGLIRKYEPKPIRIFLQDGSHDLNIYSGDWFYANQMMERAFSFAGYEVNHSWGEGAHNNNHSTAVFPDAMRWLWKGWPAAVTAGKSKNAMLNDILVDGETWKWVGNNYGSITYLKANSTGEIAFGNSKDGFHHKIDINDNVVVENAQNNNDDTKGKKRSVLTANRINGYENDFVFVVEQKTGIIKRYFTGKNGTTDAGKIILTKAPHTKIILDQSLHNPYGIALTPDQTQLYVGESNSHWVWIYNIQPDGKLTNKQRYGWLHTQDTTDNAQARGIQCDRAGRVYVATNMGVQILDQIGRVNAVLPLPAGSGPPTGLCFGGKDFSTLWVTCGDKIYRRKLNVNGSNYFDRPIKPTKPSL
jgi:gluconolactonase